MRFADQDFVEALLKETRELFNVSGFFYILI